MKVGLITTLETNIGDDFIREGLCGVLREVIGNEPLERVAINKHKPLSIYSSSRPIHWGRWLPRGQTRWQRFASKHPALRGPSRFEDCDLIMNCGTPVLWPDCADCEWAKPIWSDVVGPLHQRIPVMNLAAGSCYPWERQPERLEGRDEAYAKEIYGYCRVTTVRDPLAQKLFGELDGVESPPQLIPCSASLAARAVGAELGEGREILINYMNGAGHFDWDQNVGAQQWAKTVKQAVDHLKTKYPIRFICHSQKELDLAAELDNDIPRVWPKTVPEYFAAVAAGMTGICNRLHASVAMAGMGIQTVAVGTDTRMLMVCHAGVSAEYAKDVTVEGLIEKVEQMIEERAAEKARLLALRDQTWEQYKEVINSVVCADAVS